MWSRSTPSSNAWPRHATHRLALALGGLAFAFTACADDPLQPNVPSAPSATALRQPAAPSYRLRAEEAAFAELSRDVPSAAGFYYRQDGTMVVLVRDATDDARARATAVRMQPGLLGARGTQRAAGAIAIERARYSFAQLAAWRDLVADSIFSKTDGVIYLDLDEARNSVTLGLRAGEFARLKPAVLGRLAALGVEGAAVRLEAAEPIVDAAATTTQVPPAFNPACTMLTAEGCRPMVGGLQVVRTGTSSFCTLGFVVQHNGTNKWVTASHCTERKFTTQGDVMYNATIGWGSPIGFEEYDAAGYFCGVFATCRGSDAALFAFNAGITSEVGLIARPNDRRGPSMGAGTVNISTTSPFLRVDGVGVAYTGQQYDKIGRTSGWTYGYINATCVDYTSTEGSEPGYYVLIRCADRGNALALGGDSGGPVFRWGGGDEITALGITTGNTSDGTYFSRFSRLEGDLGHGTPMTVVRPALLSAPVLSASGTGTPTHVLSWLAVSGAASYEVVYEQRYEEMDEDGYLQIYTSEPEYMGSTTNLSMTIPSPVGTNVISRTYWVIAKSPTDRSQPSYATLGVDY